MEDYEETYRYIPKISFNSLIELRRVLSPESFLTLIYHTVIGNQVIIRGDAPMLVSSAISVLKVIIAFFFLKKKEAIKQLNNKSIIKDSYPSSLLKSYCI